MKRFGWLLALAVLGCGPSYVRGSDAPGLDDPAMSTGLDRRDLQRLLHDNLSALRGSEAMRKLLAEGKKPRIAIYPFANETSEHIDSQLDALLSEIETYLVESSAFTVISVERQKELMAEIDTQHGGGFDPRKIAAYNKQLGSEYFVTGKVQTADERTAEARRVQYFMFMQILSVATGEVLWQHKSELTKGLVGG